LPEVEEGMFLSHEDRIGAEVKEMLRVDAVWERAAKLEELLEMEKAKVRELQQSIILGMCTISFRSLSFSCFRVRSCALFWAALTFSVLRPSFSLFLCTSMRERGRAYHSCYLKSKLGRKRAGKSRTESKAERKRERERDCGSEIAQC
jgi:hypothetical protein